jgi:hypothetical protein
VQANASALATPARTREGDIDADCVHATMDAVQVTRLDATGDGALADGRHKLGK